MFLLPASSGLLIYRSVVAPLAAIETLVYTPSEEVRLCAVLHNRAGFLELERKEPNWVTS